MERGRLLAFFVGYISLSVPFPVSRGSAQRLQNLIVEYSQVCIYIVMLAKCRGYYTTEDAKLAKHRTMTVVDGVSLLVEALNGIEKGKIVK